MKTLPSDSVVGNNLHFHYEAKAVALLGLGFGLLSLDRWSLATLFPYISKDLNLNYQDLGNLTGILAIAWGITASLATRAPGHRPILRQPPGEYSTNQSSVGSGVFSSLRRRRRALHQDPSRLELRRRPFSREAAPRFFSPS